MRTAHEAGLPRARGLATFVTVRAVSNDQVCLPTGKLIDSQQSQRSNEAPHPKTVSFNYRQATLDSAGCRKDFLVKLQPMSEYSPIAITALPTSCLNLAPSHECTRPAGPFSRLQSDPSAALHGVGDQSSRGCDGDKEGHAESVEHSDLGQGPPPKFQV